jgi:transposase
MKRRVHSREFKLMIVRQLARGEKRPVQVCREHQLASSMVARWRKEYEERGEAAFSERVLTQEQALIARVAELEGFCGRLALEDEGLKKPHIESLNDELFRRKLKLLA